jgi:hypothetical protein
MNVLLKNNFEDAEIKKLRIELKLIFHPQKAHIFIKIRPLK